MEDDILDCLAPSRVLDRRFYVPQQRSQQESDGKETPAGRQGLPEAGSFYVFRARKLVLTALADEHRRAASGGTRASCPDGLDAQPRRRYHALERLWKSRAEFSGGRTLIV